MGGPDLSDEQGLRAAWDAHADELFSYALRSLGDRAAAEEVVQTTFLKAWRSASSYDQDRPLRPWLFSIMRRTVVDEARSRKLRAVPQDWDATEPSDGFLGEELALDQVLDGWMLHEALRRIRPDQRIVLVETFYGGRSYAAVARDLDIPEGTARTRAFYGLRALRLALEEMGWER